MSELPPITARFRELADAEAEMSILVGRPGEFLRPTLPRSPELQALARLVELRRRALGLTAPELAQKTGIPMEEIIQLEEGMVVPSVLVRFPDLARELAVPEAALLELVGGKPDPTGRIQQAARVFVERTAAAPPAPGEAEAVAAFVRDLEAA